MPKQPLSTLSASSRIAVIGAGSWGTTLAHHLTVKGLDVILWVRESEIAAQIRNEGMNSIFLPGIPLARTLRVTQTFEEALEHCGLVLLAAPSHVYRDILKALKPHLAVPLPLLSATKGIENDTLMMMSEVTRDVLGDAQADRFACLAGPSFAREVARRYPTAVTINSSDLALAQDLQNLLATDDLRVYAGRDVIGAQLGGALKNVIAIAAGAADGLNFGHNARAALITRGLAEITRLGLAMGAEPFTFAGLAGIGDLVLTCTGDLSRNRTVGLKLGQGQSLDGILAASEMVAEGIRTARAAGALAERLAVEMPITQKVNEILYAGKAPRDAVKELMTRSLKAEWEPA